MSATHAFALPLDEGDGGDRMAVSFLRAKQEVAAAWFVEDGARWEEVVGRPGGWQRYEVDVAEVDRLLKRVIDLARALPPPSVTPSVQSQGFSQEDQKPLLDFLKRFGPLGPVSGLVEPARAERRDLHWRMVDLFDLADEIRRIAAAKELVGEMDKPLGPKEATVIEQLAEPYLREVVALPVPRKGELKFQVRPTSLRAYVWMVLSRRARTGGEPVCLYCRTTLPRNEGRGRQPEYCQQHTARRFRNMVNERSLATYEAGMSGE